MNNLPKGWATTNLIKVAELIMGQSPPSATYNSDGIGLPFFQGKAEFGSLSPTARKYCNEPKKIALSGDILISVRAPVGPTNLCREKSCIGRGLASLRPNGMITTKYLLYYLRNIEDWLSKQGTGSTFTAIDKRTLSNLNIKVAPLNEQRRIVEKLDKLLAKVECAKARLERVPVILKRFRQAVLAAAVSGELTKDWRERNGDVENANKILENLKRKRFENAETKGQIEKINALYSYEENDNPELPPTWKSVALDKLCSSFEYGTSIKSQKTGEIPVLRMGNIQNGEIDWSDLVYSSNEAEIQKYRLRPNTVLFNRTNSPELVGKTAIYKGEQPAIFAGYLIRINNFEELDSEYLNFSLNSHLANEYCRRVKSDGVSQSNINATKLGKFELPFCDFREQQEIVKRVRTLFKAADQIEARYQKAKAHVDKLSQSILAKAFRGELVPQDPNDEPAEKLLKRIKTEKRST